MAEWLRLSFHESGRDEKDYDMKQLILWWMTIA